MARSKQKPTTTEVTIRLNEETEGDWKKHKCQHPLFELNNQQANDLVVQSLFDMATKDKNAAAAIFWAKSRCGTREKEQTIHQVPTIVIRKEDKQLER